MTRLSMLVAAVTTCAAVPLAAAPAPPAATFVAKAGASDLYEKTSSEMVVRSAANPKIREFAGMMITDHGKTTAEVTAAAKTDGLTPKPPKLDAKQVEMIAALKAAKPADREKLYLTQQVGAHTEALALMTAYSKGGDKPALKKAATGAVPTVQTHLDMVKALDKQ